MKISALLVIALSFWSASAVAQARPTAAATIEAITQAIEAFEANCGLSIMQDRLPGDVQCGQGMETIGTAWDRFLVEAGLPDSFDDREEMARAFELDQRASLVLVGGMARKEGIDYLLDALARAKAAGH